MAGLACDPGNLDDLAAATARLLTDGPEWEAWSVNALQRYNARFTAAQFQERLRAALLTSS
jgi:hypothetical protein